jgi:putative flavoprotein involved in K+ transport
MARAGATLVGRPTAVGGQLVTFDDSVRSNLAAGDAFATKIRTMLDELITRTGADAPPFQPEESDEPVTLHPPAALDIRAEDIGSVVWCSGFTGDFSWLPPELVGVDRMPRRREAAATVPGLWYVGLKWLTRRGSGFFYGFPGDASSVAGAVRAHLRS